jgi:hypothetical protein
MATGRVASPIRLLASTSSARRLHEAETSLRASSPDRDTLIVAASRGAADELARRAASARRASLGWLRFSVLQLASRLGAANLKTGRRLPGSPLGAEAIASRAVFGAIETRRLQYFGPVSTTPGFPRAVARTVGELRLAHVMPERVAAAAPAGPDLAALMVGIGDELQAAGAADRLELLHSATTALREGAPAARDLVNGRRLVLLDPVVATPADAEFLAALVVASAEAVVTAPNGDAGALRLSRAIPD